MDSDSIDSLLRDFCVNAEQWRVDYNLPEETKAMLWDINSWLRDRLEREDSDSE